jgi:VCBS repeat-containing protein
MKAQDEISVRNRSAIGLQASQRPLRPSKVTTGLKTSDEAIEEWLAAFKSASCPGLTPLTPATSAEATTAATVASAVTVSNPVATPDPQGSIIAPKSHASTSSATEVLGSSAPPPGTPMSINPLPCCGTCGYLSCPTRLLSLEPAAGTKTPLAGQSTAAGKADFMLAGKDTGFGQSISSAMSSESVAPLADWRMLPGGGNANSTTAQPGVLSGEVTQSQALAAPNAQLTAANLIALENQKLGNPESEWGLDGPGSDNIEGFTTDISVNHGSRIDFKINTDSSNYRIDIYRLGYYGGMGARKVETIQHTGVQSQPDPLRDATTGLVDAGNWAVSASWDVPADAVSGVYIAKLVRQDGVFGENEIPFIVRDDGSHSDIVFQTADETWQAYNGWGGANFYGGNGPAAGQGGGRAYAVSYNRPIVTRDGIGTYAGPQDYVFGAEYAAIYWLEQNGYDVSYMSGIDVDRYGSLLLNHKAYVDAGHDEYWSGQQRANVEAARDAGVNLEFWSGNEVYWRTRWGNSISTDATAYRTLISYKETWANSSIDPSDQWTGTFRDPRFSPPELGGGSPENSLTGTLFQVDDVVDDLESINIPYDDANLRFWRNTGIANLQPGQTASLVKNYLGYEWDEAPDNGFDPAGLVRLSSTTLPVRAYLLDYGNTTGPSTATHSLTLYRAPSGALVFGAGTVYWAWGLSDNHDLQITPTDPRVQQAMVNLFADMGIQPATLQSGLITGAPSTDHTAPTSSINAIGAVTAQTRVTISGTSSDVGGVIAGVEVSTDGGASWHPAIGDEIWTYTWTPQVAGTYTVLSRAVDDSVNLETPGVGRTITVAPPPYLTLFSGAATPAVVNTTDASAVELGVKFQTSTAGSVTGIRFYKGSQDIGPHTGELWSSTGTLLATVTFTDESASGWQSAFFSNPVVLTPNVTYVASYHTSGHYSNTSNYFTTDVTSGPLTAQAAGNGLFGYSATTAFPTGTFASANFWVDVMFVPSTAEVPPVAVDDSGLTTAQGTPTTITAASLIANDSDPDGDGLTVIAVGAATHGSVTLNTQPNQQNNTITFTPEAGYVGPASFSYTISDGRGGTASANVSLVVELPGETPVSLFSASSTPAQTSLNEGAPLELGMKFTSSAGGQITALKFYRSAGDTGPDVLDLWTSTGVQIASVTFTNTAASGWQTVALPAPVSITANTTYVASYHTTGAYVASSGYFTTAVTSGPLTAPSTTTAGGNGVYAYGGTATTGIFPTNSFNGSNYWVDVVFKPFGGTNTTPSAVADAADATEKGGAANGTGGSSGIGNVLANDIDPDAGDSRTVTGVSFGTAAGALDTALVGAHGSLVLSTSGAFTYTVNETDAAVQALHSSTDTLTDVFAYTMRDAAGATSSATLTVTIHGANDAPVLASQTGGQIAVVGSAFSLTLPAGTFTDVDAGDTLVYAATLADGSPLPAWLTFDPATRKFSGTPPAFGTIGVKVLATDSGGLAAGETFNIAITPATVSLFSTTDVPAVLSEDDTSQVNLGVRFTSSAGGTIVGIRYYKGVGDTGTHTGSLWSSTGTLLATATFTGESASGWQTVMFSSPVAISAGTTYVASYHSNGHYAATGNYFATAQANGVLAAPTGNNGVYAYGTGNLFPTSTFGATNYWVDVLFSPAGDGPNHAPLATNDPGFSATQNVPLSIAASALLANDADQDGDALTVTGVSGGVNGTASFDAQTNTVTFTPDTGYTGAASFSYAISDGRGGTASATASLTVNASLGNTVSLFGSDPTPSLVSVNDANSVELGFKFQSSAAGDITGLRFYKGPTNTGIHVADIWSSSGTLLATATFTNETASGWQQVSFATPLTINPGTTYIASYHTSGNYSADPGLFASAVSSGPLTAPSSASSGGNGVYAYGANSLFPTSSHNATSYGVDVLFRPQLA